MDVHRPKYCTRCASRQRLLALERSESRSALRMGTVPRFALIAWSSCLLAAAAWGQTQYFPLSDVKAGLRGKGKTVFAGTKVEDFDVEILGVLENAGPKQSIVLARISGGPLA